MTLSESEWTAELAAALGYAVRVEFSRARSTPIQLRHARPAELREEPALSDGWIVRLHEVFAEAPPEIRADLASWIRVGKRARRACRDLGGWTELALGELPARPPRRTKLQTRGNTHDLNVHAHELLQTEFDGEFEQFDPPRIGWGRRSRSRTRGRLHLGSFNPNTRTIRVHPVLDQPAVPGWLVRYVLFHELLHAALPAERDSAGRLRHHGPQFRAREEAYPDHARAVEWERQHLSKILRSARAGKPLRSKRPLSDGSEPRLPFFRPLG